MTGIVANKPAGSPVTEKEEAARATTAKTGQPRAKDILGSWVSPSQVPGVRLEVRSDSAVYPGKLYADMVSVLVVDVLNNIEGKKEKLLVDRWEEQKSFTKEEMDTMAMMQRTYALSGDGGRYRQILEKMASSVYEGFKVTEEANGDTTIEKGALHRGICYALGNLLILNGDLSTARAVFWNLIKVFPDDEQIKRNSEAMESWGTAFLTKKAYYEEVTPELLYAPMDVWGRPKQAETSEPKAQPASLMDLARAEVPEHHIPMQEAAMSHCMSYGQASNAMIHCIEILKFDPTHNKAAMTLGSLLMENGYAREAELVIMGGMILNPETPVLHSVLAVTQLRCGNLSSAKKTINAATKKWFDEKRFKTDEKFIDLMHATYGDRMKPSKAIELHDIFCKVVGGFEEKCDFRLILGNMGLRFYQQGKGALIEALLLKEIELNGVHSMINNALGMHYYTTDRLEEADLVVIPVLEAFPEDTNAPALLKHIHEKWLKQQAGATKPLISEDK